MKVIFRAWDGTEFDNSNDCENYEKKIKLPTMWGRKGKTTDSDLSYVVCFSDEKEIENFRKLCRYEYCDGIDEVGLYMWSSDDEKYVLIDDGVENALRCYFNDID